MADILIDIRFPYAVTGTIGRRRKTIVVTGTEKVRLQETPLDEAPLAFVVERRFDPNGAGHSHSFHAIDESKPAPIQRFEYRIIDGVLMRGLVERDGVSPLTLAALTKSETDYDGKDIHGNAQCYYWADHPAPRPSISRLDFKGRNDADEVDAGMREIVDNGRTAAHAELLAAVDRDIRIVDGRLFRAAPPPAWALSRRMLRGGNEVDTLVARLAVVDYDFPDLLTQHGDPRFSADYNHAFMPLALVGDHQKAAVQHGVCGAEKAFPQVDRLDADGAFSDFDAGLDAYRLRLLRDRINSTLQNVPVESVRLGLRESLAALLEVLEAGRLGEEPTEKSLGQILSLLQEMAPRIDMLYDFAEIFYVEVLKLAVAAVPLTLAPERPLPDEDLSAFAP